MSSLITRRTTVRESTMRTRRKSDRLEKRDDPNLGTIIDSNKLNGNNRRYSASHANLSTVMEKDYFESGSYRPDRIGKPWRSPNLSRRGIHNGYAGSESMQTSHSTSSDYEARSRHKDEARSDSQILSTTPVSSSNKLSVCQYSGGAEVRCTRNDNRTDCLTCNKQETELITSTRVMNQYNSNTNNSAIPPPNPDSQNVWSSAVSRISLWRTSDEDIVQENCSAYSGRGRKGQKQVSSIYGLDEAVNVRVTRSRAKRQGTHINAANDANSSHALGSSQKLSNKEMARFYFLHIFCLLFYIYNKLKLFGQHIVEDIREQKQYYFINGFVRLLTGVACVILSLVHCLLCLPMMLYRRIFNIDENSNSMSESNERSSKSAASRSSISPCLWWIISAVIALFLLIILLMYSQPQPTEPIEKDDSIMGRAKEIGRKSLSFISCSVCYVSNTLLCCTHNVIHGSMCAVRFVKEKVISAANSMSSSSESKEKVDLGVKRSHGESSKSAVASNDPRISQILSTLEEHDKLLRKHEQSINRQSESVQKLSVSVSNTEQITSDLKAAVVKVENDVRDIRIKTAKIDSLLSELTRLKETMAVPTNKDALNEMLKEHKEATNQEIRAVHELVEKLKLLVEEEKRETKLNLQRNEESFAALKLQSERLESMVNKPSTPEKDIERLANEVSSGHQRLVTLQAQLENTMKLVTTLQTDQSKIVLQQDWAKNELLSLSKNKGGAVGTGCSLPGCGSGLSVVEVNRLIDEALNIFAADRLAKPDFALESGGGSVIGTRCTSTYTDRPAVFSIFGVPLFRLSRSPRSVIQPAVQPGECWAFRGAKGQVVVRLSSDIEITAVTLEHMPKSLSPNGRIDSAPRKFVVKGLASESDYEGWVLGQFEYLEDGPPLQTFHIQPYLKTDIEADKTKRPPPAAFRYVEMLILSNHGHPEYTCVYRLRVHGNFVTGKEVKGST